MTFRMRFPRGNDLRRGGENISSPSVADRLASAVPVDLNSESTGRVLLSSISLRRAKRAQTPKRRMALITAGAVLLSAVTAFSTAAASGLFSAATTSQTSNFSSGTVTLSSTAGGTCLTANMFPGAQPSSCTLTTSYAGSAPALLALNVLIETQPGNGLTPLYNPSDSSHDLRVVVTSTNPTVTYTVPTQTTTCPLSAPYGSICYETDDQLVSTSSFTSSSAPVVFSTSVSLPASATTGYRGSSAQVILTVHATQASNNASTSTCTVGQRCDATSPGVGTPSWS